MENVWRKIKTGDLVRFNLYGYTHKVLAIVLDIICFPDDDPHFVSYAYVYVVVEQGYVFLESDEIQDLEVL